MPSLPRQSRPWLSSLTDTTMMPPTGAKGEILGTPLARSSKKTLPRTPMSKARDLASPAAYPLRDHGPTEHGRDASALRPHPKDPESSPSRPHGRPRAPTGQLSRSVPTLRPGKTRVVGGRSAAVKPPSRSWFSSPPSPPSPRKSATPLGSRHSHRSRRTCIPTTIGPDPLLPKVVTAVTVMTTTGAGKTRAALK